MSGTDAGSAATAGGSRHRESARGRFCAGLHLPRYQSPPTSLRAMSGTDPAAAAYPPSSGPGADTIRAQAEKLAEELDTMKARLTRVEVFAILRSDIADAGASVDARSDARD
eukprot:1844936-Rhodomonas_salina.3